MFEKYEENIKTLLTEIPILIVGAFWTLLAITTDQSYIGLAGLAILYRHYSKKKKESK
jgi:hypothetical protein